MSENVGFKVFLTCDDDPLYEKPLQIRRFVMSKGSATSFRKLNDKMRSLLPGTMRWHPYTISWKDSEGDYVLISSNDELGLALNEMRERDICKLYMSILSAPVNSSTTAGTMQL